MSQSIIKVGEVIIYRQEGKKTWAVVTIDEKADSNLTIYGIRVPPLLWHVDIEHVGRARKLARTLYPDWCLSWGNERLRPYVAYGGSYIKAWDGCDVATYPVTNQGVQDAMRFAFEKKATLQNKVSAFGHGTLDQWTFSRPYRHEFHFYDSGCLGISNTSPEEAYADWHQEVLKAYMGVKKK